MKKPTIALCMIVKNEEELLGACLESVQGVVDEIIVVDTGSTDQTKEIAMHYGAKVVDFPWVDDFAAARNFAMAQTTTDWILQLDADERLSNDSRKALLTCIQETNAEAVTVQIKNYNETYQTFLLHQYPRIYRNLNTIQYQHRVHEQLHNNGRPLETIPSDISIIHLGYTQAIVESKKKTERNMLLLEEELRHNPQNGFMHFNLGNERLKENQVKKAKHHFEIATKHAPNETVKAASALQLAKCFIALTDYEKALIILRAAQQDFPAYTDLWYLEAEVLEKMGQDDEAKHAYRTCLQKGEVKGSYMSFEGVGTLYPLQCLARLAKKQDKIEEAIGHYAELAHLQPYHLPTVQNLLHLLLPHVGKEKIVDYIQETYGENTLHNRHMVVQLVFRFCLDAYLPITEEEAKTYLAEEAFHCFMMYRHLQQDIGQNEALQFAKKDETRHLACIYACLTEDDVVKKELQRDNTCAFLLATQTPTAPTTKKKYNHDLYVKVIEECLRIEAYEVVDRLLARCEFFRPKVYVEIGDMFARMQQIDLALEYYVTYLQKKKQDADVYLKVAQLLGREKKWEEAHLFANEAHQLNPSRFDVMSFLLESNHQLQDPSTPQLANLFLQRYPEAKTFQSYLAPLTKE